MLPLLHENNNYMFAYMPILEQLYAYMNVFLLWFYISGVKHSYKTITSLLGVSKCQMLNFRLIKTGVMYIFKNWLLKQLFYVSS